MFEKFINTLKAGFGDSFMLKHDNRDLIVIGVDLSDVFRSLNKTTYFIFIKKKLIGEISSYKPRDGRMNLIRAFRNFIRGDISPLTPMFFLGKDDKQIASKILYIRNDTLTYPLFDIEELNKYENLSPVDLIREIFLNYKEVSLLHILNPYSIDICATNKMFYGRKNLINRILNSHNNFVIVGPRRIGKTSVAIHLSKEMGTIPIKERYVEYNKINKCAFVDVSKLSSEYQGDIWEKILNEFNYDPKLYLPYVRKVREGKSWLFFTSGLEKLLNEFRGELTIILDEVDDWIKEDKKNNWENLNVLRAMTDHGIAKVILVGYETLSNVIIDHEFPFNGRVEKIKIKPLDRDAVEQLIKEPLSELKISIDHRFEPEIIESIWHDSSGRPNLVQSICQEIIKLKADSDNKEIVMNDYYSAKKSSTSFNSFLESIVQSGDPLAILICGISAIELKENNMKGNKTSFLIKEILTKMESFGYVYNDTNFKTALTQLDLRDIIFLSNKEEGLYSWTNEIFIDEFYSAVKTIGLERWVRNFLDKHKTIIGER